MDERILEWRKVPSHLLFDGAIHALEDPHNPATLDDFADEPKRPRFGRTRAFLLRPDGKEVFQEPLCDEKQTEIILLCNLWALRFDILEQGREECCIVSIMR